MAKLWGTRFHKGQDPIVEKFTSSLSFDKRLAKYEILGSIAHAKMLGKCKIIRKSEAKLLVKGLNAILKRLMQRKLKFDVSQEDVHTAIINLLVKEIGDVAHKLHTARSRNDQVSFDTRMYCREHVHVIAGLIKELQKKMLVLADRNADVIMPGYTHLQHAQCVLFAHLLLAYIQMMERDKMRLADAKARLEELPLGSGAFRGTSFNIDRDYMAKLLGFKRVCENSVDAVSDRDYIVEILASLAILSMHLSRLSEDLVLWSTEEFGFIEIDESFCQGSSMMPQKKNPDVLELMRGAIGGIYGNLISVCVMLKGLPLSYNRDLQLDKEPLFSSIEKIEEILSVISRLISKIHVNRDKIKKALEDKSLYVTDIAEYLGREKGVSYRVAHDTVGRLLKYCIDKKKRLGELTEKEIAIFSKALDKKALNGLLGAKHSVWSIKSSAGTNPKMVKAQIAKWKKRLRKNALFQSQK